MVHIRINGDTFAGGELYLCTSGYGKFSSVTVYGYIRVCKLAVFRGIVDRNQYVAAAPVDDIFHLIPVKMHGRHLAVINHN